MIASQPSNIVFDPTGKCAITGALEQVVMWNVRRGADVATFSSNESKKKQPLVSRLCMSPDKRSLAVGFVSFASYRVDRNFRPIPSELIYFIEIIFSEYFAPFPQGRSRAIFFFAVGLLVKHKFLVLAFRVCFATKAGDNHTLGDK